MTTSKRDELLRPGEPVVISFYEGGRLRRYRATIAGPLGRRRLRRFEVTLEAHLGHACIGSTRDVFEAASAEEAEAQAIAAWREVRPDLHFAPLLTIELKEEP